MPVRRLPWVRRVLPVAGIAAAAALVPAGVLAATAGHNVMIAPRSTSRPSGRPACWRGGGGLSVVAARVNDGRAVVLGMAFSVMAMMLVLHALATPGAWWANGLVQVAGP